jgi:Sel1 repeat
MIRRMVVRGCGVLLAACSFGAVAASGLNYSVLDKTVPGSGGNSPEADARPGEYYFLRGVEAVRASDFEHALKMYEAAASWGYKNAQYNLAVMYARGQGVPVNLPRAMAWAALAAERNDKQYVEARELIFASLDKAQWDEANVIWRELKKEYADTVALARAKARWAEVRNGVTGSHVGTVGHLEVGIPDGAPRYANVGAVAEPVAPPQHPGQVAKPKITIVNPAGGTTAAEVVGANAVDGSLAYRALRETNDPYDPKLRRDPIGTATVEAPQAADAPAQNTKPEPSAGHY